MLIVDTLSVGSTSVMTYPLFIAFMRVWSRPTDVAIHSV